MAEGEKRKTEENDGVSAPRKRARSKEGAAADGRTQPPLEVADEEVEEFFAILKRIRAAVKYFGNKGGGESGIGRKMTAVVLEPECSAEVNGGVAAVEKTETVIKKIGVIDLNMVPNPDDNTS